MERITRSDVDRIAASVSESLKGLEVRPQGRNGYIALDLCDASGVVETLHTGPKREVYTSLQGMRRYAILTWRA